MTGRSEPPRVSVVVPVRDGHAQLPAALQSIRAQQVPNLELIVVDDGSDPPVEAMVRAHCPAAAVLRQANAGPSAARNRGLRQASGDLVAFLDADDRWAERALVHLLKGFRDAPSIDLVQGHVVRFGDERSGPYAGYNLGAALIRRETLLDLGGFDETLRHSEDVDLFMRLHAEGRHRLVIPQVVLHYRKHRDSLSVGVESRQTARNWIRLLHAHRRAAASPAPAPKPLPSDVSVLMVVRNGRRYLPDALQSIRAQSLAPLEIVAVVGPSEDGTFDYLSAQQDVRAVEQQGVGLATARNQAIELAAGRYVAFYDHDDLWDARKLDLQRRAIALFSGPGAAITSFRLVRGEVAASGAALPRLGWTPSALLAHRELFGRIGPFDPELGFGCDSDWFRRLRLSDAPCAVVPQALLAKRIHKANLSASPGENRAVMFRMLKKHRAERRNDV